MKTKQSNIICVICARSGSKGIYRKAHRKINDKNIFQITLEQAINSKLFKKILISTDDTQIIKISQKYKVDYILKRDKSLSHDKTPKLDAIKNLVENYILYNKDFRPDIVVDLDITVPLRKIIDIKRALKKFISSKASNLISVTKSRKNPYFNMVEFNKGVLKLCKKTSNTINRQSVPAVYEVSSSIYVWRLNNLLRSKKILQKNTMIYEIPYIRSIDIDNESDLSLVRKIFNK